MIHGFLPSEMAPLKVLIVEDSEEDAELIVLELKRGQPTGYCWGKRPGVAKTTTPIVRTAPLKRFLGFRCAGGSGSY